MWTAWLLLCAVMQGGDDVNEVVRWGVFDTTFETAAVPADPLAVDLKVTFAGPSGERTVSGFWDGGRVFRVRFSPDAPGEWRWMSHSAADPALDGRQGGFRCVAADGDNPLLVHGPPRVAGSGTYLETADGRPFLWLADTAWNLAIRGTPEDWGRYLATRRAQGFTAVQFVSTQWRGASRDRHGQVAFTTEEGLRINPAWFQRIDPLFEAIAGHGLVAAPVVLWALGENDPGQALSEADALAVASYIVARWGAYPVVWLLGGDGRYGNERAARWRRLGRALWPAERDRLVTMHPCGQSWVAGEFRDEPWYDFIGYQSGHGDSSEHLRWLTVGPPARRWAEPPVKPVINLEPNYEAHPAYHSRQRFTPHEVRRAAWWSLLVSPTAGVTYGHNHIWPWAAAPEVPENHAGVGEVGPWSEALEAQGARDMGVLKQILERFEWWRLRPAQELLVSQPGDADPTRFVAVAASPSRDVLLAYLPRGGAVDLKLAEVGRAVWLDPRTGAQQPATPPWTAPDEQDWLFCVTR